MMTGLPHYRMYVDGGWRDAAESIMVHSPATGAPVATVAYGDLTAPSASVPLPVKVTVVSSLTL